MHDRLDSDHYAIRLSNLGTYSCVHFSCSRLYLLQYFLPMLFPTHIFPSPLSFYVEFLLTLVDAQHAEGCDRGEGGRSRSGRTHPEIRIVECEDQSETATAAAAEWGLNLPKSTERGKPDSLSLPPEDLYRSRSSIVVYRRGSKASLHSELLDLGFNGAEDD